MEVTIVGALPLPCQIVRSGWWQARATRVRRCPLKFVFPCLQRSLGFFERSQTIAQVSRHSRFHQGVAQGRCCKQTQQHAQDQGQQKNHTTLAAHEAGTGLRSATLSE